MAEVLLDEEAFSAMSFAESSPTDDNSGKPVSLESEDTDQVHCTLSPLERELQSKPDSDLSEKYRGLQMAVHAVEEENSAQMAQMVEKVIAFLSDEHAFYSEAWLFYVKLLEIEQKIRDHEMDAHLKNLGRARENLAERQEQLEKEQEDTDALGNQERRSRSLTVEDLTDNVDAISTVVARRNAYWQSREKDIQAKMSGLLEKMSAQARGQAAPTENQSCEGSGSFLRRASGYMPSLPSFSSWRLWNDASQQTSSPSAGAEVREDRITSTSGAVPDLPALSMPLARSATVLTVAELMAHFAERSCDATAHTSHYICDGAKLGLQTGFELIIPPEYWRLRTLCLRLVESGHFVGKHTIHVSHYGGTRVVQLIPLIAPPTVAALTTAGAYVRRRLSSSGTEKDEAAELSDNVISAEADTTEASDRVARCDSAQKDVEANVQATAGEGANSEESEILMCPICFASRWDTACIPCGHLVCGECADRIGERCAQCRQPVRGTQRVFTP